MGKPVVVIENVPALPTVKVVALSLVMAGAWSTVKVKVWVASGVDAVGCGDAQRIGAAAARGRRPAERGRAVAVVQEGDAAGQGAALAEGGGGEAGGGDRERPRLPTVKVVSLSLVIAGAWSTVRVKVWVASGSTPLAAVMVSV